MQFRSSSPRRQGSSAPAWCDRCADLRRRIPAGLCPASRRASRFSLRAHCAAGAARMAQPARRAEGMRPDVKKSSQKKEHPTLAPCAQSLCSGSASLLRGSLTVHSWTGIELAHIVWANLRTISATAPALLYLLHPCSRLRSPAATEGTPLARIRQLLHALLYLGHPCPRLRAKAPHPPSAPSPAWPEKEQFAGRNQRRCFRRSCGAAKICRPDQLSVRQSRTGAKLRRCWAQGPSWIRASTWAAVG
jgi:hypothetical protein